MSLDSVAMEGKRVLVRADLNVPMKDGVVTDATRLERFVPTIRDFAGRGARVVVISHFGRPKGQRVPEMSLRGVVKPLSELLGAPVVFAEDCVGEAAESVVDGLKPGEVALLENLRFHAGEENNDPDFASLLAKLGDLYVNDAFSCAHRAHASTHGVAKILSAYPGPSMRRELEALRAALEAPKRPVAALVGGAKVSSKLAVLSHLVNKVDTLIIGGGMANTFLHAQGVNVGASLCEPDLADMARRVMAEAKDAGCRILLPTDVVVAKHFEKDAATEILAADAVRDNDMILDVGPLTSAAIEKAFTESKTLLWNGPLGAFETPPFDIATVRAARSVAGLVKARLMVAVAGGGDTVAALNHAGVGDGFTYVSTAGGAFLEWLEGKELPGVSVLGDAA